MEQDQEMHVHHSVNDDYSITYPPDLQYSNSSSAYILSSGISSPRFNHSDAFGSPHRHEQHEAEHVFNSPQLTLDPSTLNLRSNSNENPPPSANPSGSNSSTPTGSLRLSTYNLPNNSNSSGVTTRRRARAALEQLHIQIEVGVHAEAEAQSQHSHHQSDMQDIRMQSGGDTQMRVDDRQDSDLTSHNGGSMDREQGQGGATPHPRDMYSLLPGTNSQAGYYLNSNTDGFSNSPISPSSPPEASRDPTLQAHSTSGLDPSTPSSVPLARAFHPGPLSLGMPGSRSIPLLQSSSAHASPIQQQLSPSHPQLSSHPHMHPSPYYSMQHQSAASPGFPSTPTTSHHTQGSSSSSHSSGHTRYSLRGSPGPRGFGHRHARSSSFGTVSTMSVRSSSPANSVASAFTSLSGGGSAPTSASGPTGSPTSYGESGDVPMQFVDTSPPSRAQSHPPLSAPTAHPALTAYSALLPPPRKSLLQQGTGGYLATPGEHIPEEQRQHMIWPPPPPEGFMSPPPGPLMTPEEFQAQFRPRPVITRAPHRKQKLANSDRKAICMYAKQHPNARQEDIAARYNVERSTISKILKNKERWLGCPDDEAKVARKRKPRFDDLELVLKLWVEETRDQGLILSDALIRSKAKEEARQLGISEEKFKASSGWLENFKHRVGIRKGKYVGREQWLAASESDNEELLPATAEEIQKQRIIFMTNPPPGYERTVKGFWRVPVADVQRSQAQEQEQAKLAAAAQCDQAHASGSAQASEGPREQGSASPDFSRGSGPRPASRGMRKTRSRTLAEAREAALAGGPTSPSTSLAPAAVLVPAPVLTSASALAPAPVLTPDSGSGSGQETLQEFSQPPSSTSQSPAVAALPDGREASAGLDVALDFIGGQPKGFASPEEVAVLQKLSRRMNRTEPPRHHSASSASSGWHGAGES